MAEARTHRHSDGLNRPGPFAAPGQPGYLSTGNHYLLAGCVAAATAYKSRNVIATMALGLAAMFTLRLSQGTIL